MATSIKHSGFKRLIDRNPTLAILCGGAEALTFRKDSAGAYVGLQLGVPTYSAAGCADGAGVSLATGYGAALSNRFSAFEICADTGSTDLTGDTYQAAIHGKLNIGTAQSNASLMAGLFSLDVADESDLTGGNYFALRGHLDFWDDCDTSGATHVGALSAYVENESTTTIGAGTYLYGLDVYQVGTPTNSGTNPAINIRASATASKWQYGILMATGMVANGISFSATTSGISSTVTALGATAVGNPFYVTVTAPNNQSGMTAYFDATINGTTAGHCYGVGSWINTGATSPVLAASHIITPFEGGVYTGEAQADARVVFAGQHQAILNGVPTSLHAWRLNTTQTITALIAAANPGSIGYTEGTGSGTAVGWIAFCEVVNGPAVGYIKVYSATA